MAIAKQTVVLVDLTDHTAVPVPDSFRDRIEAFER